MALSLQKLTALAILSVTIWASILITAEPDPRGHGFRIGYHKHRPRPSPVRFGNRWKISRLPLRDQQDPYHPHYHSHFDRERSLPPVEDSTSFSERNDALPDHNTRKVGTPRSELTPDFDRNYNSPSMPYPFAAYSSPYYFDDLPIADLANPQLPCGCVNCRCVVQHGSPEPQPPAVVVRSPFKTQTFQLHPILSISGVPVYPLTLKQTINEYRWHSPGCKSTGDSLHGPLSPILQKNRPPVVSPVAVEGENKQDVPLPSAVPTIPQEEGGSVEPPSDKTVQLHDTNKEEPKTAGQPKAEVNEGGPVEPPPGKTVQWHDTSKEEAKATGQPETVVVNVGGPVEPPSGKTVQWHDTSMEMVPAAAEDEESLFELNEGGPVQPPPGMHVQWHDTSKEEAKATGQPETVLVNVGGPVEPPPGKTVQWHDTSMEMVPAAEEDEESLFELNEKESVERPQGKLVKWEDTIVKEGEEEGGPVEPPPEKNIKWHDTSKDSKDKMKSAEPIVNEGGPVEPPAGTQIKWHETGKNTSAAKMEAKKPVKKTSNKNNEESRSELDSNGEDEKDDYFSDVDVI